LAPRHGKTALRRKALAGAAGAPYIHVNASIDAPVHQEQIMRDNILSAVLTFSLMAAGTAAIGTELFRGTHHTVEVATLPAVTVIGHRQAALAEVTLPMVTVTGCRHPATEVAIDTSDVQQRVQ
jgi:ABC-type arginine/histidine transport system permease subunit